MAREMGAGLQWTFAMLNIPPTVLVGASVQEFRLLRSRSCDVVPSG